VLGLQLVQPLQQVLTNLMSEKTHTAHSTAQHTWQCSQGRRFQ
jgi:hypothetical protein